MNLSRITSMLCCRLKQETHPEANKINKRYLEVSKVAL